jgi:hypothetical protein
MIMKRIAFFCMIFLLVILPACNGGAGTPNEQSMAETVSAMLTNMPTSTQVVTQAPTPQPIINIPSPTATPQAIEPENTPTETASPEPSETPLPTETLEPTETVEPDASVTPETPEATLSDTDPLSYLGKVTDTDPMDSAEKWVWPTGKDAFTNNGFKNGYMWLTGMQAKPGWVVSNTKTRDAYIEAEFKTQGCGGMDYYGLIFRVPVLRAADQGYIFAVTCDGQYRFWRWNGKEGAKGTAHFLNAWTESDAIHTGSNESNRVGVMTTGNKITLYINGERVDQFADSTHREGYLGVVVSSKETSNFTVRVEELHYWNNP